MAGGLLSLSTQQSSSLKGMSYRRVVKEIMRSDNPESLVKSLPAQYLYYLIAQNGVLSSAELFSCASPLQRQLLLDFHCWTGDRLNESNLIDIFSLTDTTEDLDLLAQLIRSADLKILASLLTKYVDVIVFEEPTDNPPAVGYMTPDNGFCWLKVDSGSEDMDFHLSRVLAYIFESDAKVFYQLIAIRNAQTPSALEEEAFQDRAKRLASEGVPSLEFSAQLIQPRSASVILEESDSTESPHTIFENDRNPDVQGSIFESLYTQSKSKEAFENEFGLLLNAASVRYNIDFSHIEAQQALSLKIKGAIELGARKIMSLAGLEYTYTLSIQKLFQVGLSELREFSKQVKEILKTKAEILEVCPPPPSEQVFLLSITQPFPCVPEWWNTACDFEECKETSMYPITQFDSEESLKEVLEYISK